jgi:hypothetical protein
MQGSAQSPQPVFMRERCLFGVIEASLCKSCG